MYSKIKNIPKISRLSFYLSNLPNVSCVMKILIFTKKMKCFGVSILLCAITVAQPKPAQVKTT